MLRVCHKQAPPMAGSIPAQAILNRIRQHSTCGPFFVAERLGGCSCVRPKSDCVHAARVRAGNKAQVWWAALSIGAKCQCYASGTEYSRHRRTGPNWHMLVPLIYAPTLPLCECCCYKCSCAIADKRSLSDLALHLAEAFDLKTFLQCG